LRFQINALIIVAFCK